MGNCCAAPKTSDTVEKKRGKNKPNPFSVDYAQSNGGYNKSYVLENPTGADIEATYELGRELGRGEFGVPDYTSISYRRQISLGIVIRFDWIVLLGFVLIQSFLSPDVTIDMILRRSSRFKKAKVTAAQCEERESLPVDVVPDSLPTCNSLRVSW